MIPKRIRERLVTAQFTAEQMDAVDKQARDIVQFHVAGFTAYKDIESQMCALARDCYIQGLLDGNQVRPVVDAMRQEATAANVTELPGSGIISTASTRGVTK